RCAVAPATFLCRFPGAEDRNGSPPTASAPAGAPGSGSTLSARSPSRPAPAGEKLKYRYTAVEHGQKLHRYWTDACRTLPIKAQCTTGRERRITRWEHEEVVETVQARLDKNPQAMRTRLETVEHPFGTIKMRM